jgi:hypothetical protein
VHQITPQSKPKYAHTKDPINWIDQSKNNTEE